MIPRGYLFVTCAALLNFADTGQGSNLCNPSQSNFGCSIFARCDKTKLRCECNPGFVGDGKDCKSKCMADNQTCASFGTSCFDMPSISEPYSCLCKEGYKWSNFQMKCLDADECQFQPCLPYSKCKNIPGGYSCECCYNQEGISGFGYVGDGKSGCYPDSILEYGKSEYAQVLKEDGVVHTKIPGGFPFYGELYYDIYTHLDGYITFEAKHAPYLEGSAIKFPTYDHVRFIAPFWTDLEVSSDPGSGVYVDAYTWFRDYDNATTRNAVENVFSTNRGFFDEIKMPGFKPTVILTATWVNVTAKGKFAPNQKTRITFQGVLVTNGTHSFGFTSYAENPRDAEWDLPLDNVFIGMSGPGLFIGNRPAVRQPFKEINQMFQDPGDLINVCKTMTFLTQRGRFYKVFGPPFATRDTSACLEEATRQGLKHADFSVESEDSEGNLLPPELYCPCFEQQAYIDNRFVLAKWEKAPATFPPLGDRHSCFLSRFHKPIHTAAKDYRARAYCCYDSEGALVTKGPAAGAIVPEGYEADVIQLKKSCCFNSDMCYVFHKMFTPVTCRRYERPGLAYSFGAGHFNTLNKTGYTFNGRGEYTYLDLKRLGPIKVQIRMADETFESDRKTSFITAMVVKCNVPATPNATTDFVEHTAEVRVNKSKQLELLFDGKMAPIGVLTEEIKNMFVFGCSSKDCEITCKYQKYVISFQAHLQNHYLHINAMVPITYPLLGLIGSKSGELVFESQGQAQQVEDFVNVTQIAQFGEYNRVKKEDSLFTYADGESWETFNRNDTVFVPTYWSDVAPTINEETMDDLIFCQGERACKFDKLVTGKLEISVATLEASKNMSTDRSVIAARTPQWGVGPFLVIDITRKLYTGTLRDLVKYDEMHVDTDPIIPDGFRVDTSIYQYLYKYDGVTGSYSLLANIQPPTWRQAKFYLKFYAYKNVTNNVAATSVYMPEIFICACEKTEQCDFTYIYNRTALYRPSVPEDYHVLPCTCPVDVDPHFETRFCTHTKDICANYKPCDVNAVCTTDNTQPSGYTCKCKEGYVGNGLICTLGQCPADHGCGQICSLNASTMNPVCSCKFGYVLNDDRKTCGEVNNCDSLQACPDRHSVCIHVEGGHYCECDAGYKPNKNGDLVRQICLPAERTYTGSLTFELYWTRATRTWHGWNDAFLKPYSISFTNAARELEFLIENLVGLIEPSTTDMFTYVYQISKVGNKIKVLYKIYPDYEIDVARVISGLKSYVTAQPGDVAGFRGLAAPEVTFMELAVKNFCAISNKCSPFATCHNGDTEMKCRCNPGFVNSEGPDSCLSLCKWKQCHTNTSHSCRVLLELGQLPKIEPQCLCKKGYTPDDKNNCYKISAPCSADKNPCGPNAQCNDQTDGTYTCTCNEGYVKAIKPSPDICIPDVIFFRGEENEIPDKVVLTEHGAYYKLAIPVGVPFFDTKQWKLYVGGTGAISFGKPMTTSEYGTSHPSYFGYLVAPFWSDFALDISKIKIQVYDATASYLSPKWKQVIEEIRGGIIDSQNAYPSSFDIAGFRQIYAPYFKPKTIVIITWNDLALRPFTAVDHVTMQAVVASDGVATIFMSNYDASTTIINTWEDPATSQQNPELAYPHRGFVGFQGGERIFCLNRAGFGEQTGCRNFFPSQLVAPQGPPGRHVFLVANDASISTEDDRACFDVIQSNEGNPDLVEMPYVYSALRMNSSDTCPWTETQVKLDSRFEKTMLAPLDRACYFRKFWSPFSYRGMNNRENSVNIRPYCCYKYNALLTQAASTSHMMIQNYTTLQDDILNTCCLKAGHCPLAISYVPAVYVANGYEPPVTAGVFGDPHLFTFAGKNVTFKGRGDYVLFNSSEISIQARFDAFGIENVNGSALKSVAWKVGTYGKVIAELAPADGKLLLNVGGKVLDLTNPAFVKPSEFNEDGYIQATLDASGTSTDAVKVTYTDGLSFELLKMTSKTRKSVYFHLRIRMPKSHLATQNSGLLAEDFALPDGTSYKPKFYGTLIGDKDYFYNYGRNWTVSQAKASPLFETNPPANDFIPPLFYEDYLTKTPEERPQYYDTLCKQTMSCAYDYAATDGDEQVAQATFAENALLQKLRKEANERPPTFEGNPYIWPINVATEMYVEFVPRLQDPSSDITFTLETDFPRNLISEFDTQTGRIGVVINAETRNTFLYNGPFEFHIIATRGLTGASTYSPVAVRICNCIDGTACDSNKLDLDALKVGVFPVENKQRYQIVRCNCQPDQTGKFCDLAYSPCVTTPCYPGASCLPLFHFSNLFPAFVCGQCPSGYTGNGVHCKAPCVGMSCDEDRICKIINGQGVCICRENTNPDDGSCQEVLDRCQQQPPVCNGEGQRCHSGRHGTYWCDCKPGYAPRYVLETMEIGACVPVTYTYVMSISFDKHYNKDQDLEGFPPELHRPETNEYKTFAQEILLELTDLCNLLGHGIINGLLIQDVKETLPGNGFSVDLFAYSNYQLATADVQLAFTVYYNQTGSVGAIVDIHKWTFIDICDSGDYNPCRENADISSCSQTGTPGEGPTCLCNATLGYATYHYDDIFSCSDECESVCESLDSSAHCRRTDPDNRASMFECFCNAGYYFNTTTNKCDDLSYLCTPGICGPYAECIPLDPKTYRCACLPGYHFDYPGQQCISHCQNMSGFCGNVENAYGCQNLESDFQCLCNAGYRWEKSSKSCVDIDECAEKNLNNCIKHAVCVNTIGSYYCKCSDDYFAGDAQNRTCYAKRERMMYPYNFGNKKPIRDGNAVENFTIPVGFMYESETFYSVKVGFDGFVGLEAAPPLKYFGKNDLTTHIIAPFWMDLDPLESDPSSGLYIDFYDSIYPPGLEDELLKWQAVFKLSLSHFEGRYSYYVEEHPYLKEPPDAMVILTWVNVTAAPAFEYGKSFYTTFQAILSMYSGFSYSTFHFLENPADTKWPTTLKARHLQPRIGFTLPGFLGKLTTFHEMNSDPPDFYQIFETNLPTELRGRIISPFGVPVDIRSRECYFANRDYPPKLIDLLRTFNKAGSGIERFACPAFPKLLQADGRWQQEEGVSVRRSVCYGSKFWNRITMTNDADQYHIRSICCYDSSSGSFLGFPSADGSSFVQVQEYRKAQENLFNTCCHGSYCEIFGERNQVQFISPDYYSPPVIAFVRGDPHIGMPYHENVTETRQLTFNGRGEYILIKSLSAETAAEFGSLDVQIRLGVREEISNVATFAIGLAFKCSSDVIEVIHENSSVHVLKNGIDIDLKLIAPTADQEPLDDTSYSLWANVDNNHVVIGYATGYGIVFLIHESQNNAGYFHVQVSLPSELSKTISRETCGLLTSYDLPPFVDCNSEPATGDVWKNELDAYNFGQRFKLKSQNESLFSYKIGPTFDDINIDPYAWMPMFSSDIVAYPADLTTVCGKDVDKGCKYDYGVTLNASLARDTRAFGELLEKTYYHSSLKRPQITNDLKKFYLPLSNIGASYTLKAAVNAESASNLRYELETNLDPTWIQFNNKTGNFTITSSLKLRDAVRKMAPYLRFIAINDGVSPTLWTPSLWACVCEKAEQCDKEFMERPYLALPNEPNHNHLTPCFCPPTTRGKFCEELFDPCSEKPCGATGHCSLNETEPAGFTCSVCGPSSAVSNDGICRQKVCQEEDICTNGNCEISPKNGLPMCVCHPGYELSITNGKLCEDIDECLLGNHDCEKYGTGMKCTNKPGSWICGCKIGYALEPDRHVCVEAEHQVRAQLKVQSLLAGTKQVAWTEELGDITSQLFYETAQKAQTDLRAWYREDLRQLALFDITINKFSQGSIVIDYFASFHRALNNSELADIQKSFFANDRAIAGIVGASRESVLVSEIDLCRDEPNQCDPLSTKCRWKAGTSVTFCDCLDGFAKIAQSVTSCIDNCTNICHDLAGPNSMCTRASNSSSYSCSCMPGFIKNADGVCTGFCDPTPCKNQGKCGVLESSDYICECPGEFLGRNCELECQCVNGICASKSDPTLCICYDGYTGSKCESTISPTTTPAAVVREVHDDTALITVATVLGVLCFVLICAVNFLLVCGVLKKKQKPDNINQSTEIVVNTGVRRKPNQPQTASNTPRPKNHRAAPASGTEVETSFSAASGEVGVSHENVPDALSPPTAPRRYAAAPVEPVAKPALKPAGRVKGWEDF